MSTPDERGAQDPRRPGRRTPALAALLAWFAHGRGRWPLVAGLLLLCVLAAMALLSPERDDAAALATGSAHGNTGATGASPDATRDPVAGVDPVCNGLLEHSAWTGRLRFANAREPVSDRLGRHVAYDQDVDVSARLPEHTRRQHRGSDAVVRYANPSPEGQVDFTYVEGDGRRLRTFKADGGMRPHEEGMPDGGSMLAITLRADCSYSFYFHGHATGTWTESGASGGPAAGDGTMPLLAVSGHGMVDPDGAVRGAGDFEAWPSPMVGDRAPDKTNQATEYSAVYRALGKDMGTIRVEWAFEPAR